MKLNGARSVAVVLIRYLLVSGMVANWYGQPRADCSTPAPSCAAFDAYLYLNECYYQRWLSNQTGLVWWGFATDGSNLTSDQIATLTYNSMTTWRAAESKLPLATVNTGQPGGSDTFVRMLDSTTFNQIYQSPGLVGYTDQRYDPVYRDNGGGLIRGAYTDLHSDVAGLVWGMNPGAQIYAPFVVLHEMGHWWRLLDIVDGYCTNVVMYKYYPAGTTQSSLTGQDITGVQVLYDQDVLVAGSFSASGGYRSVVLSWEDATPGAPGGFGLVRGDNCEGPFETAIATVARGDPRYTSDNWHYSFVDTALTYQHDYSYLISDGPQWEEASATPYGLTAGTAPSVPTNFGVTRSDAIVGREGAAVSWTASSGNPTGYYVYRRVGVGTPNCSIPATPIADVTGTSYTDSAPALGATLQYRVRAHNDAGVSAASDTSDLCLSADIIDPVDTLLSVCPAGDGDRISLVVQLNSACGTDADTLGAHLLLIRDATSSPGVRMWRPGSMRAGGDDTLFVTLYDRPSRRATFESGEISGCGRLVVRLVAEGQDISGPLGFAVRSRDADGKVVGAVDRFDYDALAAANGHDVGGCWDLDFSGGLVGLADQTLFATHYGHHVPRKLMTPDVGAEFGPGDAMPISWVGALGDSARVTLRMFNTSIGSEDTVVIARDLLDSGSYSWTVATGSIPRTGYLVQVVHTAGYYGVDYRDVGMAASDGSITMLPLSVSDLVATAAKTTCTLVWTEPGQAGGNATNYDVRFRTDGPITEANWSSSTVISQLVHPGGAGTQHCLDLNVTSCRTYYFGIKTEDGGLFSHMSNVASASTRCSGNLLSYCDAQGLIADGSASAYGLRTPRYAPAALRGGVIAVDSALVGSSSNSLLWRTSRGYITDLYKYSLASGLAGDSYPVLLEQTGDLGAQLDEATLGVVDHPDTVEAFAGLGQVLVGRSGPVAGVADAQGAPIASLGLSGSDSLYVAADGTFLDVDLGAGAGARGLILTAKSPGPQSANDSSGVWVQVPTSDSTWSVAGVIHPRRDRSATAVAVGSSPKARLVFRGNYLLGGISSLTVSNQVTPAALTLTSAVHSRLGSVLEAVHQLGGSSVELDPGDTLSMAFQATAVAPGQVRELFLGVTGLYQIPDAEDPILPTTAPTPVAPIFAFSLGPARPNPSTGSVAFSFSLARPTIAVLSLYDVAGRLVRTLTHNQLAAGPHEVAWDGTDQWGRRAAPGVYFYRLAAGPWSSEKKLIVIRR